MVLTKYGAHPFTQHNNERLVKISSHRARTGKTRQTVNHYLIDDNGLIRDYHREPSNVIVGNEEGDDVSSSTVGKSMIHGVSK